MISYFVRSRVTWRLRIALNVISSNRDELRQPRLLFNGDLNCTLYLWSSCMINSERLEWKWSWGYIKLQRYEIHKVPVILHDILQRESHKPHAPPTTVT
jgi:hypothetical protein